MLNYDSRTSDYYPGRYDHEHLTDLFNKSGHTARSLSKETGLSTIIIGQAMVGECKKFETLWIINEALRGKWEDLFPPKSKVSSRGCSNGKLGDGAVRRAVTVGGGRSVKNP